MFNFDITKVYLFFRNEFIYHNFFVHRIKSADNKKEVTVNELFPINATYIENDNVSYQKNSSFHETAIA